MLHFHTTNKFGVKEFEHDAGPIEICRGPQRPPTARLSIPEDLYISKDHVVVEELGPDRARLENLSSRNPVWFGEGLALEPGQKREFALPLRITLGESAIEIE